MYLLFMYLFYYQYNIQSYSNSMDTYEFLDNVPDIPVNEIKPMDSRQQFNFNEWIRNIRLVIFFDNF